MNKAFHGQISVAFEKCYISYFFDSKTLDFKMLSQFSNKFFGGKRNCHMKTALVLRYTQISENVKNWSRETVGSSVLEYNLSLLEIHSINFHIKKILK